MTYGGIQSRGDLPFSIYGDTFLKNVYCIFDVVRSILLPPTVDDCANEDQYRANTASAAYRESIQTVQADQRRPLSHLKPTSNAMSIARQRSVTQPASLRRKMHLLKPRRQHRQLRLQLLLHQRRRLRRLASKGWRFRNSYVDSYCFVPNQSQLASLLLRM